MHMYNWKHIFHKIDNVLTGGCYAFDENGQMYCDCVTPDEWNVEKSGFWIR